MAMKAFLAKRSVKEDILSYDAHRILTTPGTQQSVSALNCKRHSHPTAGLFQEKS